jgi:hypothetical protein
MPQFPASIDLSTLDGITGFKLNGEEVGDQSGISVAAGDVNGDGFADVIVGAYFASPNGALYAGATYVVFGQASGFAATIDLSTLDGSTGFRLSGEAAGDRSGFRARAGDINGDGFADVIVGAFAADSTAGASYVVFGKASGFAADVDLSSLDGTTGFKLSGVAAGDYSGISVASAGDVNGDGFADVIVGAYNASPNGIATGAGYVVFGQASGFAANIDLSSLNGTNGFTLSGEAAGDLAGCSVNPAGDVNGDGFADLIIGAKFADANGSDSGATYIVFGTASGFAANIDLSSLDGTNGFKLSGEAAGNQSGRQVASAGDVNGDGFADVIVGAFAADAAYVVFGKASGFAANIDLSSLDGTNGFKLTGVNAGEYTGFSVATAGDVNGDGFADVIIGAPLASPNGDPLAGASYVVFGKASGFAATIDLSTLDGTNGFLIAGEPGFDLSGNAVASAGDLNGDGFADVAVGAPFSNAQTGASYVVFGKFPDTAVNRTGTVASQTLAGGDFDDTLAALGGHNDTMSGGLGNDTYVVDGLSDVVTEAAIAGTDEVRTALASYSLAAIANVENLTGTAATGQTLTGNGGNNTITGNVGNDILDGGAGNDSMLGGQGNDSYRVDSASDVVTETAGGGFDTVVATADYAMPADVEALYMKGTGLTGTGSGGADTLLSARSGGANTLVGLGGNDLYYVSHTDDTVTETGGGGFDTVSAIVDYTMPADVEALYMNGSDLTGTGSAAADTLLSTGGANTLVGLGGNDVYYVNHTGDNVTETAGGGYDTVAATVSYTMPAEVEALYLIGTGLTGTGSAGADVLLSAPGGGANTLVGLGGDDLYYVNHTGDTVTEAASGGYDTVVATVDYTMPANVEALYLIGAGLIGTGSAGADTLITVGANTLAGSAGNDTFVFMSGQANGATVDDFDGQGAAPGDTLIFSGFGTRAQGADFTPLGGNTWQIHSGLDAHNETIILSNGASIDASDFVFV